VELTLACAWDLRFFEGRGVSELGGLVPQGIGSFAENGFVNFKLGGALSIDWIGLAVFDGAAIAWLLVLRRRFLRAAS